MIRYNKVRLSVVHGANQQPQDIILGFFIGCSNILSRVDTSQALATAGGSKCQCRIVWKYEEIMARNIYIYSSFVRIDQIDFGFSSVANL